MDKLWNALRNNIRVWTVFAVTLIGITLGLYGCELFLDPRNDFADGGVEGPMQVHVSGQTNEGQPVFVVDHRVEVVQAGGIVGWISTLCVQENVFLLTQPAIARVGDGQIVARARTRLWTPQDKRCGPATSGIFLPVDLPEGIYELRRLVWAHPLGWFPQRAELTGFRFRVVSGTTLPP